MDPRDRRSSAKKKPPILISPSAMLLDPKTKQLFDLEIAVLFGNAKQPLPAFYDIPQQHSITMLVIEMRVLVEIGQLPWLLIPNPQVRLALDELDGHFRYALDSDRPPCDRVVLECSRISFSVTNWVLTPEFLGKWKQLFFHEGIFDAMRSIDENLQRKMMNWEDRLVSTRTFFATNAFTSSKKASVTLRRTANNQVLVERLTISDTTGKVDRTRELVLFDLRTHLEPGAPIALHPPHLLITERVSMTIRIEKEFLAPFDKASTVPTHPVLPNFPDEPTRASGFPRELEYAEGIGYSLLVDLKMWVSRSSRRLVSRFATPLFESEELDPSRFGSPQRVDWYSLWSAFWDPPQDSQEK